MKVSEVLGRGDYALISELIPPRAKVLDLGCGDGSLLAWLKEHKQVEPRGIEKKRDLCSRRSHAASPSIRATWSKRSKTIPIRPSITSFSARLFRRPLSL